MLYTVSGVQILATLDAFAELDERVKGGRMKIGKCMSHGSILRNNVMLMIYSHRKFAGS